MNGIIITGANGFLGKILVDRFYQKGYMVYSIVRSDKDIEELNSKGKVIMADYDDLSSVKDEIEKGKILCLYHLAWQGVNGEDKGRIDVQERNIHIGINIAKFAKELECKKILFAGTVAEHSMDSLSQLEVVPKGMLYAAAKSALRLLIDTYCGAEGINHIWMQIANVYGPTNMTGNIIGYTLRQLINNEQAEFGPALQPYDLIYEDDLIEAMYRLGTLDVKKHFYYIGSGKPMILKNYLKIIGNITNKLELIKFGVKPDDGIRYESNMFDCHDLIQDIGNYISQPFDLAIKHSIECYQSR